LKRIIAAPQSSTTPEIATQNARNGIGAGIRSMKLCIEVKCVMPERKKIRVNRMRAVMPMAGLMTLRSLSVVCICLAKIVDRGVD